MLATIAKKKCIQYSQEYLKYGFVPSFANETISMCLLYEKTFSNDAMKLAQMKDHLERIHSDKKNKDFEYFKILKEKLRVRPNLNTYVKSSASVDRERGLKTSYSISLNIAKKGKPYTIDEEIIIPAIKDVIENVMKKDFQLVLKCIPLSANTVQRYIEEMANDVERTLTSELQHCKFAIQLDESTFRSSNLLIAYVKFHSLYLNDTVDEFLFAKYLETNSKVATDGAPAIVGYYRGFFGFLKEKVPKVHTVHCVLHRQHFIAKKLSDELHDTLKVCISYNCSSSNNHNGLSKKTLKHVSKTLRICMFPNPSDVKIYNEGREPGLEDELSGICVDLKAKALFKK
ncbi:SCAN domain-containing protein 3-like [Centruroides sculpturatus]|uniref:SCAN domain-containing protein 3-like n=1 Tax=Centruroides sculpturatus TaxID=218467 RepID=UPI000C6E0DB8|nr:SCAN domain-containing protein 3-like [Centruroides sculpturatus]